jgi:hypothetical protein
MVPIFGGRQEELHYRSYNGGESSYTDLLTCLEMARDVKQLKQSPLGHKKID